MSDLKNLKKDLEEFHRIYSDMKLKREEMRKEIQLTTIDDVRIRRESLIASGQLVIDFYEKIFVPRYASCSDETIKEIGRDLKTYSSFAREYMERANKPNYLGLATLFIEGGGTITDPNALELMIKRIGEN